MRYRLLICVLLISVVALTGCWKQFAPGITKPELQSSINLGSDDTTYGDSFEDLGVFEGDFGDGAENVTIELVSGTENCYKISNNVITFSEIKVDSVYSIKGEWDGNIIIDVGDDYKFDLEMNGFSIKSATVNPITALSGKEIAIKAKKDTKNFVYDNRETIDKTDESVYSGAIHSLVDLEIGGKGELSVISKNNNGIHTKDDLQVKNLTLTVVCCDNALKGNDSVEIESGVLNLIATVGDGVKTTNSNISNNGKQRGSVNIFGGSIDIYAACDGIDAAYNVSIAGENTVLNIYTDKYSNYSQEITETNGAEYYIRYSSNTYKYSVKYYNSDGECEWINATYHSAVNGGMGKKYYYYSFPKKTEYEKLQLFVYSSTMEQGQDGEYVASSEYFTLNTTYDTIALSNRSSNFSYSWTNYTTSIQQGGFGGGFGGMNDGNQDKGDHSTKGIKSFNEITIESGTVNVKSYDDAIHANNDSILENSQTPLGNVTVRGGNISLYSNDDGVHADGVLTFYGGNINVINSYEGVEGQTVSVEGGNIFITAKDDGMNATATSGAAISLSGGFIYIYCSGDGMDSNSRSSYLGIDFNGCNAIIISNSSMNSAIDTEQGYKYSSGNVVAIMSRGGMTSESTHCSNFTSVGTTKTGSLSSGKTVTVSGELNYSFTMPCDLSNAYVIILNKNTNISF